MKFCRNLKLYRNSPSIRGQFPGEFLRKIWESPKGFLDRDSRRTSGGTPGKFPDGVSEKNFGVFSGAVYDGIPTGISGEVFR